MAATLTRVTEDNIEHLIKQVEKLPEISGDGGGGPGGYNGPMETRIKSLESFADDAKQRLVRLETKIDHIDKEVSNFKWWAAGSAVAIILAMIAAVLGTGIAIQQMTVSTFQAAGSQAHPAPQQPIIFNVPQAPPALAIPPATAPPTGMPKN